MILWGAVVRATGSGAGCGDHWPLCNGVVVQTHPQLATIIELTHRMTSGITVIAVLLLVVWIFRATVAGHLARITAIAAAVLTFNEALLGALLVLLRLTANNRSAARGRLSFAAPGQYSAVACRAGALRAFPLAR